MLTKSSAAGSIAVASDGTIYVGEQKGQRVREIREGVVSTLCHCEGDVDGLLLDELSGLLYVRTFHRILSVVVPTRAARLQQRCRLQLSLRAATPPARSSSSRALSGGRGVCTSRRSRRHPEQERSSGSRY